MNSKNIFLLCLLITFSTSLFAQKYEAESAVFSEGAAAANALIASGGSYVQMKEGNLNFSVQVASKGLYTLKIQFSQTYGDTKTQNLSVNASNVGSVTFLKTGETLTFTAIETTVRLNAGTNTISINNSWGWVDIDYIELLPYQKEPFSVNPNLASPNPTVNTIKLYGFLREYFQKNTISGVMTGEVLSGNTPLTLTEQPEVAFIKASSGKTPALVGFDFIHSTGKNSEGVWYKAYNSSIMGMAEELWNAGGIPAFCWHWKDPLQQEESFYTPSAASGNDPGTTFDLTTAFTNASYSTWDENSNAYKAIIKDIDIVSEMLAELQDKGIAVLWRPIHEASGGWFWWGAKGAAPFVELYKLMFNRMVNINGLKNLIWVWNSEGGNDLNWYPGDDYVDIIGRDFYYHPAEKNHSSLIGEFEKLKTAFGTNKILALAENGSVPYPENMKADGADWSYFMPWYGEHTNSASHNLASDWNLIMNHDYVITLENMPGWNNYSKIENPFKKISGNSNSVSVSPTFIKESVNIYSPEKNYSVQVINSKGEVILSAKATSKTTSLSTLNWNKGVYFISITGQNTTKTFKVIR